MAFNVNGGLGAPTAGSAAARAAIERQRSLPPSQRRGTAGNVNPNATTVYDPYPPAPAAPGAPPPPPPPVPWVPYSAPGYGEKYYEKTQDEWLQPGSAAQYWNGQKGFFNTPQAGQTAARDYAGQLGSGAGATSAMEGLFNKYNITGELSSPWAAEDYYKQNKQFFATPGAMENFYGQHQNDLNGPGSLEQHQGALERQIGQSNATQNYYRAQQGQLNGPGYTERLANGFRPEQSFNENFLLGGGASMGLDSLYNRLYSEGSRKLGNEGAARGGYNSGASMRASEELNRDLSAQHVKDVQTASGQADLSKMARLRLGLDTATGADKAMMERIGQGTITASTADKSGLDRGEALRKVYEGVGVDRRENLKTAGGLAKDSQQGALDRILGGVTASAQADAGHGIRVGKDIDAARYTGDEAFRRFQGAANVGLDADKGDRDQRALGGTLSTEAGNEDILRRISGQNAANSAQTQRENREKGVLDNLMKVAEAQAGRYAGMTSEQRGEELKLQLSQIEGLLSRGEIDASTATQMRNMYMQMLQSPLAAAGSLNSRVSGRTSSGGLGANDGTAGGTITS